MSTFRRASVITSFDLVAVYASIVFIAIGKFLVSPNGLGLYGFSKTVRKSRRLRDSRRNNEVLVARAVGIDPSNATERVPLISAT